MQKRVNERESIGCRDIDHPTVGPLPLVHEVPAHVSDGEPRACLIATQFNLLLGRFERSTIMCFCQRSDLELVKVGLHCAIGMNLAGLLGPMCPSHGPK